MSPKANLSNLATPSLSVVIWSSKLLKIDAPITGLLFSSVTTKVCENEAIEKKNNI